MLTACLCCLLAIAPSVEQKAEAPKTIDLLPAGDKLPGWEPGAVRTFSTARALFDYMNGGAEIYVDYGFRDLAVREWTSPEGDPVTVEVYRMGSPKSAYGMFTQDTWGEEIDVGQGGQIQGGTVRFWKGEYFVRVFMWRGYRDHRPEIMKIARSVADRIEIEGEVPAIVPVLPAEDRVAGGLHFFHTALTLGAFYYLSDSDPLGLSRETDGVIGEYLLKDESTVFLVLISYPDAEKAADAFADFTQASVQPGATGRSPRGGRKAAVFVHEDGLWRAIERHDSFLVLVLDSPSEGVCRDLLGKTMANLKAMLLEESREKEESASGRAE